MSLSAVDSVSSLYQDDETAWLEQMARLIEEGRLSELDYDNLREFLIDMSRRDKREVLSRLTDIDMSRRDKREVLSRLTVLIAHWLKWEHQPDKRSKSWRATIEVQRRELEDLLESGTLRSYADQVLSKAYERAIRQAAIETDMAESEFPSQSTRSLDEWLSKEDDDQSPSD